MEETEFFKKSSEYQLTAAHIGVSCDNWLSTTTTDFTKSKENVFNLMKEKRFDILPSLKKEKCEYYISNENWNVYELNKISQNKIKPDHDCIYYLTHVKDLVRLFVQLNRNFFFLTNHTEIVGLITIGDLNNKFFYYYLYQKLVNLERNLSGFLLKELDINGIWSKVEELSKQNSDMGKWFMESYGRYNKDSANGTDSSILEYLYLGQFIELINSFKLFKKLGYKSIDELRSGTKVLNEIRKTIAHPTRSIISQKISILGLCNGMNKIDELNKKLLNILD